VKYFASNYFVFCLIHGRKSKENTKFLFQCLRDMLTGLAGTAVMRLTLILEVRGSDSI
jgi:hypothetical protein